MIEMTVTQAAAEAQKFAQTIRAFSKLTEVIDVAVSAEQLAKESAAATDKARAELEGLRGDIATAGAELAAAKESAAQVIADGKGKAAAAIDNAEAKASNLIAEAEADRDAAAAVLADANAKAAEIDQAVAAMRAELADIEGRIAKAKEQARALLGG
jgi:predicted  nucleic acid-binding Zn-ribbon protein